MILNNIEKKGQKKRNTYQRRLPENPSLDYYYILREINSNEPVLIEYGFIDNKKDAEKLKNNIEEYAEAVVESITTYLKYPYKTNKVLNEYIVQKGDTLYSIGKNNNISIDELKRINNLKSNDLYIGQLLKFKEEINNPLYIVKKGDTVYSIAIKNNISVDKLIKTNNLSSTSLYIGQQLYIPTIDEESKEKEYDIYTVKKGDSLWKISQEYDITVPKLIDLNNLSDLNININQKLIVPKKDKTFNNYIVQKGDSLWSIAKKYNQTVDELKEKNNLTSNLLSIGQKLII